MTLMIVFAWSFAGATVLLLSSEVPLAIAVRQTARWELPVLVVTAGNYLGACTTYYLARAAAAHFHIDRRPRTRHAAALLRRFGSPALVLSSVPLIADVLVAVAGAANVPFGRFSLWVILGKGTRYLAVAWLAVQWS